MSPPSPPRPMRSSVRVGSAKWTGAGARSIRRSSSMWKITQSCCSAGLSLYPLKLHRNTLDGQEVLQFNPSKTPLPEDRIHHFVHSILDGKKNAVPPEESLRVQQVTDAIYESAAARKEVRLG